MEDFWLVSLSWLLVSSSFPSPQQTLEIQKCYLFSYIFWGFKFIRYAILQQYPLRYCHLGDQLWSIKPKVPRRSVMSDSLQPHGLLHARPPCSSPTPGVETHVNWVGDAIQPSHPLSSPSPPAFNLSQHQGLFQWVSSSHQVAKVLELQLQHQFFQWIFRINFL